MIIKTISNEFSICKLTQVPNLDSFDMYFLSRTDEELSLVVKSDEAPEDALATNAGWKAFRIDEVLDFSLIGIISKISRLLADSNIGIFVISTYNTDYILTKKENYDRALKILITAGYDII